MAKMTILYTPNVFFPKEDVKKVTWDSKDYGNPPSELIAFRFTPFDNPSILKTGKVTILGNSRFEVLTIESPLFDENSVYSFSNKERPDSDAGILILESWHKEGSDIYLYLFAHLGKKYVMCENDLYDYLATDKPFPWYKMWWLRIRGWMLGLRTNR